jgi:hypothetical protein
MNASRRKAETAKLRLPTQEFEIVFDAVMQAYRRVHKKKEQQQGEDQEAVEVERHVIIEEK